MSSVFLLIPLALAMLAVAAYLFVWAVHNEQFDDLDGAASRILFDDEALHLSLRQQQDAAALQNDTSADAERSGSTAAAPLLQKRQADSTMKGVACAQQQRAESGSNAAVAIPIAQKTHAGFTQRTAGAKERR